MNKGELVTESTGHRPSLLRKGAERSWQLALAAARTASDNKGRQIAILDMREQTPLFDYFVIATGTSGRQLRAMSEDIDHKLEDDLNDKRQGISGFNESRWIVLDYGTVVIHLFDEPTRKFYDLENLWSDCRRADLPTLGGEAQASEAQASEAQASNAKGDEGASDEGETEPSDSMRVAE